MVLWKLPLLSNIGYYSIIYVALDFSIKTGVLFNEKNATILLTFSEMIGTLKHDNSKKYA